jgi:hypothetical protein
MAAARATPAPDPMFVRLDDIAALLAVLIKRGQPTADVIGDLAAAGLGPTRIAGLLGTTPGYVDNVVARRKAAAGRPKKAAAKTAPAGKAKGKPS